MIERSEGLKHSFYLTLSRLGLMRGKPIFWWDPNENNGHGAQVVVFFLEDEE